jgi:hypothetical protein
MSRADDLILIGATGVASLAPLGSTAPTTENDALNAAFVDLGGITTDGLEEAFDDTVTDIPAWGSRGPVVSMYSQSDRTFKFTALETNAKVLEVYFRQGSALTATGSVIDFEDEEATGLIYYAAVFDVAMDADNFARFYLKKVAIKARDSVTYKEDGAAMYPFTLTAYRDSAGSLGHRWYDLAGLA